MITIDGAGRIVALNAAAEQLLGLAGTLALGRDLADLLIPARLRPAHRLGLQRVLAGGPSRLIGRRSEVIGRRTDGRELSLEIWLSRTSAAPPRFTVWVRDLSAVRRSAIEVAERERLLEQAEDLAGIGSWVLSPGTGEMEWSDKLTRILGFGPARRRRAWRWG